MAETSTASRNILIFADGTDNKGGLLPDEVRTNVYKLFRATRVDPTTSINPQKQIAFYVPGIGTPDAGKPRRFDRVRNEIDSAIGGTLGRRIVDCYMAAISVWHPGDRIYLFGFSRGAYTARCVAHVLEQLGIPTQDGKGNRISFDPKKLRLIAEEAVRILYRFGLTTKDTPARDQKYLAFRTRYACRMEAVPFFIGVWETVAAIGWSRLLPHRDDVHLPRGVEYVRHAMAIDEFRSDFRRVPWGGSGTLRQPVEGEPEPFEQVWFAGDHADVGGGYPENESRLSDITLDWMVEFITQKLPPEARVIIDDRFLGLHPSSDGMMHDECMVDGVGGSKIPWGKTVRIVDPEGTLHSSVFERLAMREVRNFESFGPYRPRSLAEHPAVEKYFQP